MRRGRSLTRLTRDVYCGLTVSRWKLTASEIRYAPHGNGTTVCFPGDGAPGLKIACVGEGDGTEDPPAFAYAHRIHQHGPYTLDSVDSRHQSHRYNELALCQGRPFIV